MHVCVFMCYVVWCVSVSVSVSVCKREKEAAQPSGPRHQCFN